MDCGKWTHFKPLTEKDFILFYEATKELCGAEYKPVLVATQVVKGTNYEFICNATSVTNPPMNYIAKITIYYPLYCEECTAPRITSICRMECECKCNS